MTRKDVERLRAATPDYHRGWGGPEYTDWRDEQMSWKSTCYLGDWSFLVDLEVSGPDALKVFQDTSVNGFGKFAIGQAKHVVQCTEAGKVVAEGVLMRMSEDTYRVQSTPARWTAYILESGHYDATSRIIDTFQFQVSGPNALALCQKVTGAEMTDIKFMHFGEFRIAGRQTFAVRQGMAGEIGFEFHGAAEDAEVVRAAILEAGEAFGIRQLGRRTAMINHLEAAFPTGGWHYLPASHGPGMEGYQAFLKRFTGWKIPPVLRGSYDPDDISDLFMSPYDLGWGKSIRFDHDFTGRAALEHEAENPNRQRVTLEFDPHDVTEIYNSLFGETTPYDQIEIPHPTRWVTWADEVQIDGRFVGISSTPGYSYYFRKVLSLAFVAPEVAQPGTKVNILWGSPGTPQRLISATVAPAPYKTDRRRGDLGR
ncbi:aminomethyl transferase family protein [Maritimibacter sp. DP07]|uniref:Aminomethyl transferase family protein n=1 Tax=Maritimibacter harenae TaxID=2606218 RepID=A0A845M1S6_9RHOB|nr:aminomethyl transferase family protein [Maritimibacter harenae]MZR11667.1 aminomethyl transferase family protein [Maritimibacter harenae]